MTETILQAVPRHQGRHRRQRHDGARRPGRRSKQPASDEVIVVGFDGSDDAIKSIPAAASKATSLQPVAEMAEQAVEQADEYLTDRRDGPATEKQSIDMVLITPDNACQYERFAPTGSTDPCS